MTTNVMVDIETMSLHPEAVIASIGACIFDLETGEISSDTFYKTIHMKSCEKIGLRFDAGTVEWWLTQPKEVVDTLFENRVNIDNALCNFSSYFPRGAKFWSHSSFDSVILASAFKLINLILPWGYRDTRDIRTLIALAEELDCGVNKVDPEIPHHSLYDAIAQAQYCSNLYQSILSRQQKMDDY